MRDAGLVIGSSISFAIPGNLSFMKAIAMEGFDYARARRDFSLDIPKDFNFAFDVVRPRALNADKTAIIEIDKSGMRVTHHAYS
ncbi:MAG: hypothetical protein VX025_11480, partial [Pseudomonadota bacterium]|nr:hypothetical protein [Pseudomonadota bacterium]